MANKAASSHISPIRITAIQTSDSSHRNSSRRFMLHVSSVVRGIDGMAFFARQRTQLLSMHMNRRKGAVEGRIVACDLIKYAALFLIPGLFIIRCALSIWGIP